MGHRIEKGLLAVAMVTLVLAVRPAPAAAANVAVSPPDTTVEMGQNFTLRVVSTDAVADLKAYEVKFQYDPVHLQFTGATAGDVMTGTGRTYQVFVMPDVDGPNDTAIVDCAMLDGSTSGPGVLVYLHFTGLKQGDSPITCAGSDFRDSANAQTLPSCTSGVVHVTGPTPVRGGIDWGRLKLLYR